MALPATDNFDRSNGAVGANWTRSVWARDLTITSNQVGSPSDDTAGYWNADAPDAAQYAQVTLKVAQGWASANVRASATDFVGFVEGYADATKNYSIQWYNGGSWTLIGSAYNVTPAANDVIKATANGTTFTGILNGTERCSGSNTSAPSTGYGGIYCAITNDPRVDDFEVGNLSSSLSVNISDTVGTSESKGASVGTSQVNKSETVGTSESKTANIVTTVNISDTIGAITDTPGVTVGTAQVNKSETVSTAENVGATVGTSQVNVFEAIGTAENVVVSVVSAGDLDVNINDTAGTAESVNLTVGASQININDTVGTVESTSANVSTAQINISDTAGTTESVNATVGASQANKSETIGTAESVSASVGTSQVNVNDTIGTTENVTATVGTSQINKSETVGTSESVTAAVTSYPETFEGDIGSWAVTVVESGSGDVTQSNTYADTGTYSARCFTTASGDTAYVRYPSWSSDYDNYVADAAGDYTWQRARVYVPSATIAALSGSEYLDLAGFWQSDGNGGWWLRLMASGAMYGVGYYITTPYPFKLTGTIPTDEWFTLEIGLYTRNTSEGAERCFIVLVNGDAYGWYREGEASNGDKNYNRIGIGVVGTNSADDLNVYVDNWQQYTTGSTPSGTDNRPTGNIYTLDYRNLSGENTELHVHTWAWGDPVYSATYGVSAVASNRIQIGPSVDRLDDLSDGWTEICIDWAGGATPPWIPESVYGLPYFGPMVAFRKDLDHERNLEVQLYYNAGDGSVDLIYDAWVGSATIYATWEMPNDAGAGNHPLPGRGDKIRVRWYESSATNLRVIVDYYDASAGAWSNAVIDDDRDLTNVSGENFLDNNHRAVAGTIDSDDYSIRYQTAGTYATFALSVNTSETIGTNEATAESISSSQVNKSETIGTSENIEVSVLAAGTLALNVSDSLTVGEANTLQVGTSQINTSETIGTTESISATVLDVGAVAITVSDTTNLTEYIGVTISTAQINVTETISTSESILAYWASETIGDATLSDIDLYRIALVDTAEMAVLSDTTNR